MMLTKKQVPMLMLDSLLVKPDAINIINDECTITSPIKQWMGKNKKHKGFYDFDFSTVDGRIFVENSYCFPATKLFN